MKSITINGSQRESVGKTSTKALRNAGQVPCVLYGAEAKPVHFSAPELAFSKLVYTANAHTVVIALDNGEEFNAVMQDIQFHPVTIERKRIGSVWRFGCSTSVSVKSFEAGSGVGGTWYWNRYPGARFDSES